MPRVCTHCSDVEPLFIFGDFNFRLDCPEVVKVAGPHLISLLGAMFNDIHGHHPSFVGFLERLTFLDPVKA